MCGCTGGTSSQKVSGRGCSGNTAELHKIRNSLITLWRVTGDLKYKETRTQVEELLKNSSTQCPEFSLISELKNYIVNEYTVNNITK